MITKVILRMTLNKIKNSVVVTQMQTTHETEKKRRWTCALVGTPGGQICVILKEI